MNDAVIPCIHDEAMLSHVGRVRSTNEDSYGSFRTVLSTPDAAPQADVLRRKGRLYVLADGMGGHAHGAMASALAVQKICTAYYDGPETDPATCLRQAIALANVAVYTEGQKQESSQIGRMGTTVVCAVIHEDRLILAHVGDSRAYRLRDGQLYQLTVDHDWITQQMQLHRLSRSEAEERARLRGATSALLRAVGVRPTVEPEVAHFDWRVGDRLLMSSDGLHGLVDHGLITDIVQKYPASLAAHKLIAAANEAGGNDNITVVLVQAAQPASHVPATRSWRRVLQMPIVVSVSSLLLLVIGSEITTNHPMMVNGAMDLINVPMARPRPVYAPTATIDVVAAEQQNNGWGSHVGSECDCLTTNPVPMATAPSSGTATATTHEQILKPSLPTSTHVPTALVSTGQAPTATGVLGATATSQPPSLPHSTKTPVPSNTTRPLITPTAVPPTRVPETPLPVSPNPAPTTAAPPTATPVPALTHTPTPTNTVTPTPRRSQPKKPDPTTPPTALPTRPTTTTPTAVPTEDVPTAVPTAVPTEDVPTAVPTAVPTEDVPTAVPTAVPTEDVPTAVPTAVPTEDVPTEIPTVVPSDPPIEAPTEQPSVLATGAPTDLPPITP
jgi:PPM family protein phosphatase